MFVIFFFFRGTCEGRGCKGLSINVGGNLKVELIKDGREGEILLGISEINGDE